MLKNFISSFKVIDETLQILSIVELSIPTQLSCHELLQQLRKLRSMAIYHFNEKIVPYLQGKYNNKCDKHYPTPSPYPLHIF